jgi:hypothetical protein
MSWQLPPQQVCPAGQATPPPHSHAPLVHESAPEHAAHEAPLFPHELTDCEAYASHVPSVLQQPLGHVVASHEQVPFVVSQRLLVQGAHAAPAVPHDVGDWDAQASHVPLLQQPWGQDTLLHTH